MEEDDSVDEKPKQKQKNVEGKRKKKQKSIQNTQPNSVLLSEAYPPNTEASLLIGVALLLLVVFASFFLCCVSGWVVREERQDD